VIINNHLGRSVSEENQWISSRQKKFWQVLPSIQVKLEFSGTRSFSLRARSADHSPGTWQHRFNWSVIGLTIAAVCGLSWARVVGAGLFIRSKNSLLWAIIGAHRVSMKGAP